MPEVATSGALTSTEVAAWVQAVGSLVAIGAAIVLAWWQQRENRAAQERQAERQRRDKIDGFAALVEQIYRELFKAKCAANSGDWLPFIISRYNRDRLHRYSTSLDSAPIYEAGNWRIVSALISVQDAAHQAIDLLNRLQDQNVRSPSLIGDDDCAEIDRLFTQVDKAMRPIVEALAFGLYVTGPLSEWKEHLNETPRGLISKRNRPPTERQLERNWRYLMVKLGARKPTTVAERAWAALHGRHPIPEVQKHKAETR